VIVYFDTSALIKRYLTEPNSQIVLELWARATVIAASQIIYAEMNATFARKGREQPRQSIAADQARDAFRSDWVGFERIAVDSDVNRWVDVVLSRYPLRGADAIHLAAALRLRELVQDEVTFACADVALVGAALQEGLVTSP
jgi:predicted nucleic acid-binding protein